MTDANEAKKISWWQIGGRRARLEELEQIAHEQSTELESVRAELSQLQAACETAKQTQEKLEKELAKTRDSRDIWEKRYHQRDESLQTLGADKEQLQQEQTQLQHQKQQLQTLLAGQQEQHAALLHQQNEARNKQSELQEKLTALQREKLASQALLAERDDALEQQEKLNDIIKETSALLHQKTNEKKELEALYQQSSAALVKAQQELAQERNAKQKQEESVGKALPKQQILQQWLRETCVQALEQSLGDSAILALNQVWEACFQRWLETLGGHPKASLEEQLGWMAELLQQTSLCKELTWQKQGDQYEFQFQGRPALLAEVSNANAPMAALLHALLSHATQAQVRLLSFTAPSKDHKQTCTFQIEL